MFVGGSYLGAVLFVCLWVWVLLCFRFALWTCCVCVGYVLSFYWLLYFAIDLVMSFPYCVRMLGCDVTVVSLGCGLCLIWVRTGVSLSFNLGYTCVMILLPLALWI